ncbi:excinuclease ABC subunit UvrB [Mariniblastus fucicola]|uniref:UvrABC system protein B n=1 Tax=Mariniblastus fucicola TaxID=980251 RepID=A0A5B9P9H7_9BACT|nr:excinuclease ABC subunit UvrB [Mariniblastus fucicola]QEG21885.1 UvrABC system protein B [Mariniblastus fucicola]
MFKLESPFKPGGDQPQAIDSLVAGIKNGQKHQVLMGVTGSGKTFTMANVIQKIQKPTLVISHNKTLAAQLYSEFKEFFPHNAVHYFVSYYDYYQPEAYIPQRDIYIEKDASINEDIDRLRLATTSSLVSRKDVIIIASVSSIYGLGSPEDYKNMMVAIKVGESIDRDKMLGKLIEIQYQRNDIAFERSRFRVRGDSVEIWPSYEEFAYRVEFWGDEIEKISVINPLTGESFEKVDSIYIYPAKHFVSSEDRIQQAVKRIRLELKERLEFFQNAGKLLEAQRLNARTRFDLEMMEQVGHCPGIENYSRHIAGREEGQEPETLYNFFPKDFLLFIDESHVTVSQVRAMYAGDQSRKNTLIDHGFRLPSARDNRPLQFEEWENRINKVVYVSATPNDYEMEKTEGEVVEQIIRPTGLLDPIVEVLPASGQVNHLLGEAKERIAAGDRVLVTALTKRLAEDLATFFCDNGVSAKWLHSELDAFERVELLRDLRLGVYDCLIGVNLLREGLDLPEVSLVGILDADKEGFLRSETSLIQTIGRSARNVNARVILYGDKITKAMKNAIEETARRRKIQEDYNTANNITPHTVKKEIKDGIQADLKNRADATAKATAENTTYITEEYVNELRTEMLQAAEDLEFERAGSLRDRISQLQENIGKPLDSVESSTKGRKKKGRRKASKVPRPRKQ